ncbi:SPX domain-containing protein [Halteromyces radiatus]|uniref:SPX domain-containing protein n=1 Tax=Halteromyces radiatus TaxID=101107 RepID=UPI002220DA48|nr:SPX domain-containing protein [Halteromyces radiatus]KAI8097751.1 SPX domain-containing protein [Halteromyces radiatus]
MKFAKKIETEAIELPVNWRPYLIKYRSLKKSLHFVVEELLARGLSPQLLSDQQQENWTLVYAVDGDTKNQPHPCIKIMVDDPASFSLNKHDVIHQMIPSIPDISIDVNQPFQYKIDLIKDMEFFRLLLKELEQAVALYDLEKQRFLTAVQDLESLLLVAASPHKKDLYVWREIFHLYLSRCPLEKNCQDYEICKARLMLLSNDIKQRKLDKRLSSRRSKTAFGQFLAINQQINIFQRFQSLNTTAMTKILKKHDKRSGLSAKSEFPTFAKNNSVFLQEVDMALFQLIQSKIISIVPQPDDYACPVCYGITWRPIRLQCHHVFCVRCLIKAHRKRLYDCPLCREEMAVGNAGASNLDKDLQDFLLLYFPREIKEKRNDNEKDQMDKTGSILHSPYRSSSIHSSPSSNCTIM